MVMVIVLFSIAYTFIKTAEIRREGGKLYEIVKPIQTIEVFEANCLENNRIRIGIYNSMKEPIYNVTIKMYYENYSLYDTITIKELPPLNIFRFETYHPNESFRIKIYYKNKTIREIYFTCK